MKSVAFMRLHSFDIEPIDLVINKVAQYVDGIFFLVHNLQNPKLLEAAERHPKCCGVRYHPGDDFDLGEHRETLSAILSWAHEVKPKYVLEFDEDEIPPDRFTIEFDKFKKSDYQHMYFRFFWTLNDINRIILAKEGPDTYKPYMKVYKWNDQLPYNSRGSALRVAMCDIDALHKLPRYYCPYPMRHLAIFTPRMREIRLNRKELTRTNLTSLVVHGKHWWNVKDLVTIPYDKDMTWKDYLIKSRYINKIRKEQRIARETLHNHK